MLLTSFFKQGEKMNFLKSLFFKSPIKKCGGCKFKQQQTMGEFVS